LFLLHFRLIMFIIIITIVFSVFMVRFLIMFGRIMMFMLGFNSTMAAIETTSKNDIAISDVKCLRVGSISSNLVDRLMFILIVLFLLLFSLSYLNELMVVLLLLRVRIIELFFHAWMISLFIWGTAKHRLSILFVPLLHNVSVIKELMF